MPMKFAPKNKFIISRCCLDNDLASNTVQSRYDVIMVIDAMMYRFFRIRGLGHGLLLVRRQVITKTNAVLLWTETQECIEIHTLW